MVLKSEIEKTVEEQQMIMKSKPSGLLREMLSKVELSSNYVLIITGIRRCGKSTLMQQISNKETSEIAYFNFEDPRVFGFETTDFTKLIEVFGKLASGKSSKKTTYFFDEIQNVAGWEVFIRYLNDQQKIICITGSNASLLSKELGTKLTGRNIQIELFPFSFVEYCSFKEITTDHAGFLNYLQEGGFPDYLKTNQKEYLQQLFKDIIYRDIIVRYGIRNAKLLTDIALFLLANTAKTYSLNGIKKAYGVGSTNSVADYVAWLEDSYLLFSVPRFSWSLKSVAINLKKIYTIDTGFAQANSLSFSEDRGRLLENAVFLALRRKFKDIFYFSDKGECDFVVKEGKKIKMALQVCTEITPDNMARELNGLVEALTFFKLNDGVIVTLNQTDTLTKNRKVIHLIPAHLWIVQLSN